MRSFHLIAKGRRAGGALIAKGRRPRGALIVGVAVFGLALSGASAEELQALPMPPTVDAPPAATTTTMTVTTTTSAAPALPVPPSVPVQAVPMQAAPMQAAPQTPSPRRMSQASSSTINWPFSAPLSRPRRRIPT